jgi:hypothetical protein
MITWEQTFELYELNSERFVHEESGYASSEVVNFFDLSFVIRAQKLSLSERSEPRTGYSIQLKYQSQLFSREQVSRLLADYQALLEDVIANPDSLQV